jgi:hypothetical protein
VDAKADSRDSINLASSALASSSTTHVSINHLSSRGRSGSKSFSRPLCVSHILSVHDATIAIY